MIFINIFVNLPAFQIEQSMCFQCLKIFKINILK